MDCIDLFKRAAMALQTDPRYVILDQARKANDKDEELQNLIGEFNLARMDLNNEIGKNERDDARIAELNEKVNSLYGRSWATRVWWHTTRPSASARIWSTISTPSSTPP